MLRSIKSDSSEKDNDVSQIDEKLHLRVLNVLRDVVNRKLCE